MISNKLHGYYVDKHLTHFNNITYDDIKEFDFELFAFDTESCTDKLNDNTGARVYAWSIGATGTDKQLYGETLEQFYKTLEYLAEYHFNTFYDGKAPKRGQDVITFKFPIGVHNLAWDVEFLKYFFEDSEGFKYTMGEIKNIYKPTPYQTVEVSPNYKEYNIVQNDGIVYGCEFCFKEFECKTRKGNKYIVRYIADMWDTLKIFSCPIEKIDSFCSDINPMFKKLGESYDYDKWRSPSHVLTTMEKRYLYNDVYRLKLALEQFYLKQCEINELKPNQTRTASTMAFAILKKLSFLDDEVYRSYYGIGDVCKFETTRERLERLSYQGGYTHINKDIINKEIVCDGSSYDINSSYPSQMMYEVLPYGSPIQLTNGYIPEIVDNENHVALIEIGFDYVEPKEPKFNLPVFKIGVRNLETLKPIVGENVSGNEYFATNIFDDEVLDIYATSESETMETFYNKVVTSVEYDFLVKHYNFGKYGDDFTFSGLEIGSVITYKAERGKLAKFIDKYNKMKMLYKGTPKEEIKRIMDVEGYSYFDGILTVEEINHALEYGIDKDESLIAFAKLCLNSSYGKFGTKSHRSCSNTITDKNGVKRFATPSDDEYVCYDYIAKEYYRPVASFITAYGRLKIWNTIIALGVENFLYTDTDSIYQRLPKEKAIEILNKSGQYVDSKKLGYWDCEHEFTKFKGLSQKKYMLQDKPTEKYPEGKIDCRCSGVPKEVQKELCKQGFDEFYLGKEIDGKKQRVKVRGGALLLPVKFKISTFSF